MPRIKGPRKINRYPDEFKVRAVRMSALPGVQVQDVAHALDLHPFMLSRWRKLVREGLLVADDDVILDPETTAELGSSAESVGALRFGQVANCMI